MFKNALTATSALLLAAVLPVMAQPSNAAGGEVQKRSRISAEEKAARFPNAKAHLLRAKVFTYNTRHNAAGHTVYILTVSAQMPDACHTLRLVEADNKRTKSHYEVKAIQYNLANDRPDIVCTTALYDDVETLVFLQKPAEKGIRVIGANTTLLVPLQ